jgi:hypothetical protein
VTDLAQARWWGPAPYDITVASPADCVPLVPTLFTDVVTDDRDRQAGMAHPIRHCLTSRSIQRRRSYGEDSLDDRLPDGRVAARTRAEATAGFPTAGARDAVTAYSCERLHNDDRVAEFL